MVHAGPRVPLVPTNTQPNGYLKTRFPGPQKGKRGGWAEEDKRKNNEEREESEIHYQIIMNRWVLKCSINSKWGQRRRLPTKIKAWVGRRKGQEGWTHCHRDTKRPVGKVLCLGLVFLLCWFYSLLGRKYEQNIPTQTSWNAFMHRNKTVGSPQKEKKGTKRTKPKPKNGRLNCQISVLWAGILEPHASMLAVWWASEVLIGCSASFLLN